MFITTLNLGPAHGFTDLGRSAAQCTVSANSCTCGSLLVSCRCLVVAGGVACNQSVRAALQDVAGSAGLRLVCPPPYLCTDNGVMVAWAGAERFALGLFEPSPPPLRSAIAGDALPKREQVGESGYVSPQVPAVGSQRGSGSSTDTSSSSSSASSDDVSPSSTAVTDEPSVAGVAAEQQLAESAGRCRKLWEDDEWVELRPRWPLTNRVDQRSVTAVAGRAPPRGLRSKRLHRSLTELTADALATKGGTGGNPDVGISGQSAAQEALDAVAA